MSIPIGISTLVDLDLSMPELLDRIASAGFSHVGLSHDVAHAGYQRPAGRRQLARWLQQSRLELDYIHPPITPYIDLCSLDEGVRAYSIALHEFIIRACAELGGQALTVHANNDLLSPPEEDSARAAAGRESLARLGELGLREGVLLCVENQPGNMASQRITAALLPLIADLPGVALTLDPNHARIDNEDYLSLVECMAPAVRATHFSDTMGAHDSHQIPGEGVVDFAAVGRLLGSQGFGRPSPGGPRELPAGRQGVLNLESSLWMLRRRLAAGQPQPGDPESVPTTDEYLMRCADSARRIALGIEAAWPVQA
ncbi:sugar phosphate isomerase/epimerase [bacterium]|nr:sugar phosphate isomerase/epimerase [bacterium]